MTDTRRLQRTLFRMQADPGFARAVLARETGALASTGLAAADLELLAGLDPAALSADPGGRRRTQIAGNASSEYAATLAWAGRSPAGARLLEGFLPSPELHAAIAAGGRLPVAFGAWALRRAREEQDVPLEELAALELAMARLRRDAPAEGPPPGPGEVRLSPRARIHEQRAGTLAQAEALRVALAEDRPTPAAADVPQDSGTAPTERESVLLLARPATSPHRLPDLHVELLQPPADELLRRAASPLSAAARARFAREHGAEPEDLEDFLAGWIEEHVLLEGPGHR